MTFVAGRAVDLAAIVTAIREAGFELKWIEIEVSGPVTGKEVGGATTLSVNLRSRNQEILILQGQEDGVRARFSEVARWADEPGRTLRIRGRAHTHEGGQVAMTIESFEVLAERGR